MLQMSNSRPPQPLEDAPGAAAASGAGAESMAARLDRLGQRQRQEASQGKNICNHFCITCYFMMTFVGAARPPGRFLGHWRGDEDPQVPTPSRYGSNSNLSYPRPNLMGGLSRSPPKNEGLGKDAEEEADSMEDEESKRRMFRGRGDGASGYSYAAAAPIPASRNMAHQLARNLSDNSSSSSGTSRMSANWPQQQQQPDEEAADPELDHLRPRAYGLEDVLGRVQNIMNRGGVNNAQSEDEGPASPPEPVVGAAALVQQPPRPIDLFNTQARNMQRSGSNSTSSSDNIPRANDDKPVANLPSMAASESIESIVEKHYDSDESPPSIGNRGSVFGSTCSLGNLGGRNATALPVSMHNWQSTKKTVKERLAFMFNSDVLADIYFVVGK